MFGRAFRKRAMLAATCLALVACSPNKAHFQNTDITGAAFARDFSLIDHTGKPRTLADYRGKVVLMSFGFTHCPDICPATLASQAAVMQALGDSAKDVQVLFVSVDPERDTPLLLSKYVPAFNPTFVGLSGSAEQVKTTAAEFKVIYQKSAVKEGRYSVDHSTMSYAFDRQGRVRLLISHGTEAAKIAADLKKLL